MDKLINWFKNRGPLIATLILLAAVPLYPKFPLQSVKGTYVSIRMDDIIVGIAILVCLISQALKGLPLLKSRILKLFFIFWSAGLIANLVGLTIGSLGTYQLAALHWLRRIQYMSLFFVGYQAVSKKKDLKDITWVVGLTFAAVFIYALGQKFWHLPVISTMNEEFSKGRLLYLDQWVRVSSTFAGHYDLAGWLVIILAFLPAVITKTKKGCWRVASFILGIISLYLLILTASRVSFVAYLIAITVSLILLKKIKWLGIVLMISLLMAFTSKELNARLRNSLKSLPAVDQKISQLTEIWETESEKIAADLKKISLRREDKPAPVAVIPAEQENGESESATEETAPQPIEKKEKIVKELRTWPTPEEAAVAAARSSNIRFVVEWPRAVRAFRKNPLTGTGYFSLGLATDNDYLRMLGETGILGFSAFMLIITHLLITFWSQVKNKRPNWKYAAGFMGVIIGMLANAVYIDIFEASKVAFYFWLVIGIGYKIGTRD